MTVDADPGSSTAGALKTPIPAGATLADRAFYELRDRITTLRMPPGTVLVEEKLMSELGMSRTPIREAILRLDRENLVTVLARRGTFVSEINVGDVRMIYELRRELEVLAAGWAAERRTEHDVELIDAQLEKLRNASEEGDARWQLDHDQPTHQLIWRISRNRHLEEMLGSSYIQALRIWFAAAERVSIADGKVTMETPYTSLVDLLEAIKAQDVEAARACARRHNEAAEASIRSAL